MKMPKSLPRQKKKKKTESRQAK